MPACYFRPTCVEDASRGAEGGGWVPGWGDSPAFPKWTLVLSFPLSKCTDALAQIFC